MSTNIPAPRHDAPGYQLDDGERSAALTRVPPQNLDAEQSVIASLLLSGSPSSASHRSFAETLETGIVAEDYYRPAHGTIHRAICRLAAAGEPVDAITVADELTRRGELVRVGGELGRHPVLLPPRLAELLRQLAEQPQLRPQLSRVRPGPRWLFPGMVPGKPISTHGMTQKLNRYGIPVRTARNAALAALAADLPSPILADVTGMHRHTALRWVAYARRDWAEYVAARAEDKPGDVVPAVD